MLEREEFLLSFRAFTPTFSQKACQLGCWPGEVLQCSVGGTLAKPEAKKNCPENPKGDLNICQPLPAESLMRGTHRSKGRKIEQRSAVATLPQATARPLDASLVLMARQYFSDRVRGPRLRENHELTEAAWGGIVALYGRYVGTNWLAESFPMNCLDSQGPFACDEEMLYRAVSAEIPELGGALRPDSMPPTLAALDLLEFIYAHASEPVRGAYHKYFEHYHLDFDGGKGAVQDDINRLLSRSGMAFELSPGGRIESLAPAALEVQLKQGLAPSVDPEFDELLDEAVDRFRSPDSVVQRKAVEPLWDAFERMKTILDSGKRRGVAALLDAVSRDDRDRQLLEDEMRALTRIGNEFRIRHHEISAVKLDAEQAEWLFSRLYSLIVRLHPALI